MRILLVVRPCLGGIASHVASLIKGLKKLGQEVFVAGPDPAPAAAADGHFFLPLTSHPLNLLRSANLL
ncbi:MAG TPA: hypothetical protein GX511_03455, partial [Firmicutes bacterium]|nr:hypothetical protein [Bacillota bacterium]